MTHLHKLKHGARSGNYNLQNTQLEIHRNLLTFDVSIVKRNYDKIF
jgi:hypothetical protein